MYHGREGATTVSIHALRKERDTVRMTIVQPRVEFQSTRSARSATIYHMERVVVVAVSIHALRKERDTRHNQCNVY